ncbi:MAG: hypothetical protein U5L04_11680 [Trueperaceae bacterium]|nr:hypothetical protein [Trueperaceae bacterium]
MTPGNERRYVSVTLRLGNTDVTGGLAIIPAQTLFTTDQVGDSAFVRATTATGADFEPIGSLKPVHGKTVDPQGNFVTDFAGKRDDFVVFTEASLAELNPGIEDNFNSVDDAEAQVNLFPYGFSSLESLTSGETTSVTVTYSVPLQNSAADDLFDLRLRVVVADIGTDFSSTAQDIDEIDVDADGVDQGYEAAYGRFLDRDLQLKELTLIGNATRLIADIGDADELRLLPNFRLTGTAANPGALYLDSAQLDPNAAPGALAELQIEDGTLLTVQTQPTDTQAGLTIEGANGGPVEVFVSTVNAPTVGKNDVSVIATLQKEQPNGNYEDTDDNTTTPSAGNFDAGTATVSSGTTPVASFDDLVIGDLGIGTYRIVFEVDTSVTTPPPAAAPVISSSFEVTAGPTFEVIAPDSLPEVGVTAPIGPVSVEVKDEFGNPVTGVSVTASKDSATSGTLNGTVTVDTADDGNGNVVALFDDLSIDQPGTKTLTFTVDGADTIDGTDKTDTSTVEVAPTLIDSLTITTDVPQQPNQQAPDAFEVAVVAKSGPSFVTGRDITATLLDGNGDPLLNDSGDQIGFDNADATLTLNSNGSVTVATDASGVAEFTGLEIDTIGDYQIDFTVDGLTTSTNFTINPGPLESVVIVSPVTDAPLATMSLTPDIGTQGLNAPFEVIVEARDTLGNPISATTPGIDIVINAEIAPGSGNTGTLSGGANQATDADGQATFSLSIDALGEDYKLTFNAIQSAPTTVLKSADSDLFDVLPVPDAGQSTVTLDQNIPVNATGTLTIELRDSNSDPISGLDESNFLALVNGGANAVNLGISPPFSSFIEKVDANGDPTGDYEVAFTPSAEGDYSIDKLTVLGVDILDGTARDGVAAKPSAGNSAITQKDFKSATGPQYLTLSVTVQDAANNGLSGYVASDFTFVSGTNPPLEATSFDNSGGGTFSGNKRLDNFVDLGGGNYEVDIYIGGTDLIITELTVGGVEIQDTFTVDAVQ